MTQEHKVDEVARQAELSRAREQAAASRVELAPFKKAFAHLDPENTAWMLETLAKMGSENQQDQAEAADRLGSLTVNWMGESFVPWVEQLTGVSLDAPEPQAGAEMEEEQLKTMLAEFQKNIVSAVDSRFNEQASTSDQRERFNAILGEIRGLGYNPDSWQGKMLLQTAADETGADVQAAHAILQERGIQPSDPVAEETPVVPAGAPPTPVIPIPPVVEPASVPPTGGQVGGTGIPETPSEEIIDFGMASDATLELLTSIVGGE
tara:strand:+ start:1493 stop:2284 length:792 start_codon:yes stop_codon:yes gene_type:complete